MVDDLYPYLRISWPMTRVVAYLVDGKVLCLTCGEGRGDPLTPFDIIEHFDREQKGVYCAQCGQLIVLEG